MTALDCPCCGCVAAEPDEMGYYRDEQKTVCACEGIAVAVDEEGVWISGDCTLDHEAYDKGVTAERARVVAELRDRAKAIGARADRKTIDYPQLGNHIRLKARGVSEAADDVEKGTYR